jgi:BirA family transcriptional regulator, biotin operon repressor / biotin---[acetyl-CoA-carboxylase] ligase
MVRMKYTSTRLPLCPRTIAPGSVVFESLFFFSFTASIPLAYNEDIKLRHTPSLTTHTSTQFIGQRVIYEAVCASTNSLATQCLDTTDLPEGTVIITDHQYRGRGQRGNVWHSEPYKNLTFSVILYPTFLAAQQFFLLNTITALAVQNVLVHYTPSGLCIKWPNDIYHQNKKLGGILIENVLEKHTFKTSIIGIGLNVNQLRFDSQASTSLSLVCQRTFDLRQLLSQILASLEGYYLQLRAQDVAHLREAYLKDMYWMHEIHTFKDKHHTFQGIIKGVDAVGKLVIEQADGTLKHYSVQEVIFMV